MDQAQSALTHARRRIKRTPPMIKRIRVLVNNVAAGPILEIGLRFVLQFLRFLSASRVLLNSIYRLVNTKLHTFDFGKELTTLQGSVFRVYSFPFYFIMKMFNIKLMCN
jgi:hypothetical protein